MAVMYTFCDTCQWRGDPGVPGEKCPRCVTGYMQPYVVPKDPTPTRPEFMLRCTSCHLHVSRTTAMAQRVNPGRCPRCGGTLQIYPPTAHDLLMRKVQIRVDAARLEAANRREPFGFPAVPMPPPKPHYVLHIGHDRDGEIWQCVPVPKEAGTVLGFDDSGRAIRHAGFRPRNVMVDAWAAAYNDR